MTERRSSPAFATGAAGDVAQLALLNSGHAVLLAFTEQLHAGTLTPKQHASLRLLEETLALQEQPSIECPRESGGGQGGTAREAPIAPLSGGAYSPFGRPAASLVSGESRL